MLIEIEDQAEKLQKEHAKEIYSTLNNYLIIITEMRNRAFEAKYQFEYILDIADRENSKK